MFRKKKIAIAKKLAAIIYMVECDTGMDIKIYGQIMENIVDIAYDISGVRMANTVQAYIQKLRDLDPSN